MNESKTRILICGSNWGSIYFKALDRDRSFKCVGLLARGSKRSINLAQKYHVPLFQRINDIRSDIDIACVAIRGRAIEEIVSHLIKQKVNILCEHPLPINFVCEMLELAQNNEVKFHINTHFADLANIRTFINRVREESNKCPPLFVLCFCSPRTMFSMIDIIGQSIGNLSCEGQYIDTTLLVDDKKENYFSGKPIDSIGTIILSAANIPIILGTTRFISENDNGTDAIIGHCMVVVYPHVRIILPDTFGRMQCVVNTFNVERDKINTTGNVFKNNVVKCLLNRQIISRVSATLTSIKRLRQAVQAKNNIPEQNPKYLLSLVTVWEILFNRLVGDTKHLVW